MNLTSVPCKLYIYISYNNIILCYLRKYNRGCQIKGQLEGLINKDLDTDTDWPIGLD
jgi:hypothetical protein